jgi:hypothetical protein
VVACPVWLPDRPHLLPKEESHLARGAGWRWASAQLLMLELTISGTIELGKHAPSLRNKAWGRVEGRLWRQHALPRCPGRRGLQPPPTGAVGERGEDHVTMDHSDTHAAFGGRRRGAGNQHVPVIDAAARSCRLPIKQAVMLHRMPCSWAMHSRGLS